jgi:SAM-dependent methyltransferase
VAAQVVDGATSRLMSDDPADGYFGESVAAGYDEGSADRYDPAVLEPAVDFLARLAAGGPVLELGIGTGRVALALASRGIDVHGIELSKAMATRLRAKPGAERIGITIGDFATAEVPGRYTLAYLVYNTIMNLTTQQAQVACFRNVARHLEPGGHFVIEVLVPDLQRLAAGERFVVFDWGEDHQGVDEYDVINQGVISHHFVRAGTQRELRSIPFRYVWPAELDLMAQMAGMQLRERWAGWRREPFNATSRAHVSVWQMR